MLMALGRAVHDGFSCHVSLEPMAFNLRTETLKSRPYLLNPRPPQSALVGCVTANELLLLLALMLQL